MAEDLLRAFRYRVKLMLDGYGNATAPDELGNGGFQECTGLDIELDIQEHPEGGRNDGVIRHVGRAKYSNLVLKRGMLISKGADTVDQSIWDWIQGIAAGVRPVARYNGLIQVMDPTGGSVLATWEFERGLPSKVAGPQLNAQTGQVAIEELHIAHEGLRMVVG